MSLNTSALSAGAVLDLLRQGWRAQTSGALTASWMIHGKPGVGKSQVVRQLADELNAALFDLRLTTIEPQDLLGLPHYDHESRKTIWYRPADLPDAPDRPSILFLDELTAASPYVQPTVHGLLQERRVGQHHLPDSVMIIAAGNAVEDGAIAYEMGTALSDRLIHLHMQADARDWVENYAAPKGLSPAVSTFLRSRPDLLDTTDDSLRRGLLISCTPRAWERVSDIMGAISDRHSRQVMIAGTVGDAVAAEFSIVAVEIAAAVQIKDLLEASDPDRATLLPASLHGMNAVVFGLVGAADGEDWPAVIETMELIHRVAPMREEPEFAQLPLAELAALGFELLMVKAFRTGAEDVFARSDAYARYAADRAAQGLD